MKYLKLIMGFIVGGIIGFAIVAIIIVAVDGKEALDSFASMGNVEAIKLVSSIALSLAFLIVCAILNLCLHEVGHLLGGLATGYHFYSIRFGKYALTKTDDKLQWKRFNIAGTGGQCIMFLDKDLESSDNISEVNHSSNNRKVPYFWYNAGGVLMNLFLAVASILILQINDVNYILKAFLLMMAFCGIGCALLNGIPASVSLGINNDGKNILLLHSSARNRYLFLHSFQVIGELGKGSRIKDMPSEWFSADKPFDNKDYFGIINYISYISRLEDEGRFEEAQQAFDGLDEILLQADKSQPSLFELEIVGERMLMELLTTPRQDVISRIWNEKTEKYLRQNSHYSPIKLVALYAIALLHEHNQAEADELYQELTSHQSDFYLPGEVGTALFLAEEVKKSAYRHFLLQKICKTRQ